MVTYREICRAPRSNLSKSRPGDGCPDPNTSSLITTSPPDAMASPDSYLCDTLPQAKLAQITTAPRPTPSHGPAHISAAFRSEQSFSSDTLVIDPPEDVHPTPPSPQRKLCPRHKRMADEGTSLKLQQVRGCRIANARIVLTHIPPGFGCPPFAGAGGRQHHLGELLGLTPSSASFDSPRSPDHVLLLSAFPPRRPTLLHYPNRSLFRSSP